MKPSKSSDFKRSRFGLPSFRKGLRSFGSLAIESPLRLLPFFVKGNQSQYLASPVRLKIARLVVLCWLRRGTGSGPFERGTTGAKWPVRTGDKWPVPEGDKPAFSA